MLTEAMKTRIRNIARRAQEHGRNPVQVIDRLVKAGVVPHTKETWDQVPLGVMTRLYGSLSPLEAGRLRREMERRQKIWAAAKAIRRLARRPTPDKDKDHEQE